MSMDEMITPRGDNYLTENGSHDYTQRTWVGNLRQGITPEAAFEALRYHAVPNQTGRIFNTGDISNIRGPFREFPVASAGEVVHYVFPDAFTIVNTTLPGHIFYPGNVFRTIVQEGNDIYVVTHGYGTDDYKNIMETFAQPLRHEVTTRICR